MDKNEEKYQRVALTEEERRQETRCKEREKQRLLMEIIELEQDLLVRKIEYLKKYFEDI